MGGGYKIKGVKWCKERARLGVVLIVVMDRCCASYLRHRTKLLHRSSIVIVAKDRHLRGATLPVLHTRQRQTLLHDAWKSNMLFYQTI